MNRNQRTTIAIYTLIGVLLLIMTSAAWDARAQLRNLEGLPEATATYTPRGYDLTPVPVTPDTTLTIPTPRVRNPTFVPVTPDAVVTIVRP